jgi:hypothetical protein
MAQATLPITADMLKKALDNTTITLEIKVPLSEVVEITSALRDASEKLEKYYNEMMHELGIA